MTLHGKLNKSSTENSEALLLSQGELDRINLLVALSVRFLLLTQQVHAKLRQQPENKQRVGSTFFDNNHMHDNSVEASMMISNAYEYCAGKTHERLGKDELEYLSKASFRFAKNPIPKNQLKALCKFLDAAEKRWNVLEGRGFFTMNSKTKIMFDFMKATDDLLGHWSEETESPVIV